jgi:hypothetical protein
MSGSALALCSEVCQYSAVVRTRQTLFFHSRHCKHNSGRRRTFAKIGVLIASKIGRVRWHINWVPDLRKPRQTVWQHKTSGRGSSPSLCRPLHVNSNRTDSCRANCKSLDVAMVLFTQGKIAISGKALAHCRWNKKKAKPKVKAKPKAAPARASRRLARLLAWVRCRSCPAVHEGGGFDENATAT